MIKLMTAQFKFHLLIKQHLTLLQELKVQQGLELQSDYSVNRLIAITLSICYSNSFVGKTSSAFAEKTNLGICIKIALLSTTEKNRLVNIYDVNKRDTLWINTQPIRTRMTKSIKRKRAMCCFYKWEVCTRAHRFDRNHDRR